MREPKDQVIGSCLCSEVGFSIVGEAVAQISNTYQHWESQADKWRWPRGGVDDLEFCGGLSRNQENLFILCGIKQKQY